MATIDATLAGATSNSYVTLAEATAIVNNLPFDEEWLNTSADDRTDALVVATRWLETLT